MMILAEHPKYKNRSMKATMFRMAPFPGDIRSEKGEKFE
jgi:hypothetical protein